MARLALISLALVAPAAYAYLPVSVTLIEEQG